MFSRFFIDRPRFALVISIILMIAGALAIINLPVAQYPQITPPEVQVTAVYPGADSQTVMQTVIMPIEAQVNGVKDMLYMQSHAGNDGSAVITVTFASGSDNAMNTVNVQNRVASATAALPEDVVRQGVTVKEVASDMLLIINLHSPQRSHDYLYLSNFVDINIRDRITRIHGVGDAEILGGRTYAMRLWLDPDRMAAHEIEVNDVITAIRAQNVQVAAGKIGAEPVPPGQQFEYTVRAPGRLADPAEFLDIVITADDEGAVIRVDDIASVELGANSYAAYGELNEAPGVLLAVYQLPESNGLQVATAVHAEMAAMAGSFPDDLAHSILYDTTRFIKASVNEVVTTLFVAVLLVVLVVFIFLQDWRATLIPAVAIPVSLIGTFAVLLVLGYSINLITLFGLILAIGVVVDDAIVVIENVSRLMSEENLPPHQAAIKTMTQVTGPVIATTLVLMAVFVPVMFLPGITGELYRQFAVTISVAVMISSLNALTLSPALSATILRPHAPGRRPAWCFRWFNCGFAWLTARYHSLVGLLLPRAALVIIVFTALMAFTWHLYNRLPTGFVPMEDQGVFMVDVQLPDDASLQRTGPVMAQIQEMIAKTEGVADVMAVSGYGIMASAAASNYGLVVVVMDEWSRRTSPHLSQAAIIGRIQERLSAIVEAQAFAFAIPPIPGLGSTGGFEFILQNTTGASPQELAEVGAALCYQANQDPGLAQVYSSFRANVPQLFVELDRDKALAMGVSPTTVFQALQSHLGGFYVNDLNKFGKTYQVLLQATGRYRNDQDDILRLHVRNATGEMVPLGTMVNVSHVFAPQVNYRHDMYAAMTINGAAAPGRSSGEAIAVMERLAQEHLPDGYTYTWTGTAHQEKLAGNLVLYIYALALLFIYLFLVAQYESWMIPFAVMLSVPIAFFGAVLALHLAGLANDIYAQIGLVLLFGIASKTAILIVEFAKVQHEREGQTIIAAAQFAANLRFRAVIMTAVSFILGVAPLVVATGAGAASRRSLGTTVFGGMLVAGILGTILVPAFYVIIQKITEWCAGPRQVVAQH